MGEIYFGRKSILREIIKAVISIFFIRRGKIKSAQAVARSLLFSPMMTN